MQTCHGDAGQSELPVRGGSPFVWQPYLEWLATHDELIQPEQFVVKEMEAELKGRAVLEKLADRLLSTGSNEVLEHTESAHVRRWLRLEDIRHLLMAERLAVHIHQRSRGMHQASLAKWVAGSDFAKSGDVMFRASERLIARD